MIAARMTSASAEGREDDWQAIRLILYLAWAGILSKDDTMTWIRTIPTEQAPAELRATYEAVRALYPPEYGVDVPAVRRTDGTTDSITEAHSLIPEAMRLGLSFFAVLLRPDLPLTRRQHEMITTVVSANNRCVY
jgi:hypothetical protein